jgi:hypothetical protein
MSHPFDVRKTRSFDLLTRRSLFRGAALAVFATPIIRKMEAFAQQTASPRRVILIFSPNGPMMANGPASGSETGFTLHDWWRPLDRHRNDGLFLSHMAPAGLGIAPGREHGFGGQAFSGYGANGYDCRGESIDEVIARRLQAEGRAGAVRSVVWGLEGGGRSGFSSGPNAPKSVEVNPQLAWGSLFQNFVAASTGANTPAYQQALADLGRKRSVLDFVGKDCLALQNALGAEGMRLLDEHCASIRTAELALATPPPPPTSSCVRPGQPAAQSSGPDAVDARCSALFNLMAMALACERTHVIAFQFAGQAARNRLAGSYGVPSAGVQDSSDSGPAHHPWTHEQSDMPGKRDALRRFTSFYSNKVAELIDVLKATNDASGKNLLDSTLVVWLSELGGSAQNDTATQGWTHPHQITQTPVVLFGSGQGTFRTGRYRQGPSTGISDGSSNAGDTQAGREVAQTLVSVVQYMGLTDVQTVGATQVAGRFEWLHR